MSWHEFSHEYWLKGRSPDGERAMHELFCLSLGKSSGGPWKDGKRFAYNGYHEEWGGCMADLYRIASEVLLEKTVLTIKEECNE